MSNHHMNFCAFLRGVNVKGTSMKMADVVKVFEKAGMTDVKSVLATGNIIFSSEKNATELKNILEKAMSEHFSYDAFLFIKTKKEVEEILAKNPFSAQEGFHIYSFVGTDEIEKVLLENFNEAEKTEGEDAKIAGSHFYWKIKKGSTLDAPFGKILGRKNLKDRFTSRNINTFGKIVHQFK